MNAHGTILEKEGSDFCGRAAGTLNINFVRRGCPLCDSDLLCVYDDLGTTDFCDTYNHICVNPDCTFMERHDEFGSGMSEREEIGPASCPFCGRPVG